MTSNNISYKTKDVITNECQYLDIDKLWKWKKHKTNQKLFQRKSNLTIG